MGSCNQTAIESALIRVPNVSSAKVIVNESDTTDSGGRPPHSFTAYITGGVGYEEQIAETIFDKKPIGIKTYGSISQEITDEGGYTHTIYLHELKMLMLPLKSKLIQQQNLKATVLTKSRATLRNISTDWVLEIALFIQPFTVTYIQLQALRK